LFKFIIFAIHGRFLVADTQLYKRLCPSVGRLIGRLVGRSVGWSVTLELKSGKTRISAPAHPSATDGRVSGLVNLEFHRKEEMRNSKTDTKREEEMLNPIQGRYFTNNTRVESSKYTGVYEIVNRCEASA